MRRGARAARGAEPRGAEGAEAVATLARVLGLLTRRPGPPLPSRPLRADAPSPSVPRGFLQTSARVSGGRGPLQRSAGGLFLVPFRSSPPRAGRCLFLETLSFGRSGSPGSRSNSRLPPSVLPPRPAAPGRLPGATRARPWPPGIRSSPLAGLPGPGQELGVGRCPLGSWSLLCSRPAPTGEGRRGGSGGCAGEASGGLGPGSGLGWGPGFIPAFQSVQLFGFP